VALGDIGAPVARTGVGTRRGTPVVNARPAVNALEVRGLDKSFGGLRVTASVELSVADGERRLIIGPNGAGKTTLFNLITGELRPDAGTVALFGNDITRLPTRRRAHLGLARTYQIITLFPGETLLRNVTLALLGLSPLRWNPIVRLDRQTELIAHAHGALQRVGLEHLAERPVAQTSYGERRRVEIAMALAQGPRLLLLDEPFAGLSVDERRDVLALIGCIPRDVTIVMIEHDMDVALEFAEHITVLHFGEVVVEGTRTEVVGHRRTREIYLGA
jgi:branched-chain amino acid transport system ATP-binding protein